MKDMASSAGFLENMVSLFELHVSLPHVVEAAAWAFSSLTTRRDISEALGKRAEFLEMLVLAMKRQAVASESSSSFLLATVRNMCLGNVEVATAFGSMDGGAAIVLCLRAHIDSSDNCEKGAGAMRSLAEGNATNKEKLAKAGALEAIHEILSVFASDPAVCRQALGVIIGMASITEHRLSFGAKGGCATVARVFSQYKTSDAIVAEKACGAIRNLSFACSVNKIALGACKAVTNLVVAVRAHVNNAPLVEQALGAIRNMCVGCESNRRQFAACEGLEMLIAMLLRYPTNADISEQTCGAIMAVASFDPANKEKLRILGVKALLKSLPIAENVMLIEALKSVKGGPGKTSTLGSWFS